MCIRFLFGHVEVCNSIILSGLLLFIGKSKASLQRLSCRTRSVFVWLQNTSALTSMSNLQFYMLVLYVCCSFHSLKLIVAKLLGFNALTWKLCFNKCGHFALVYFTLLTSIIYWCSIVNSLILAKEYFIDHDE